jgi:hypothetical protein
MGRKIDFSVREVGKFSGESPCLYLRSSSEYRKGASGRDPSIGRWKAVRWLGSGRLLVPTAPRKVLP